MILLKEINGMRFFIWLVFLINLASTQDHAQSISPKQIINKAYKNWVKATNAKDIKRWTSYLAPDAVFHPPNNPALIGNKAITDYYLELFSDELFALKCNQDTIIISESMDFAWSTGKCEATFTGQDGKKDKDKSKWIKIWIRLPNGDWKCKINSWSSILKK